MMNTIGRCKKTSLNASSEAIIPENHILKVQVLSGLTLSMKKAANINTLYTFQRTTHEKVPFLS